MGKNRDTLLIIFTSTLLFLIDDIFILVDVYHLQ